MKKSLKLLTAVAALGIAGTLAGCRGGGGDTTSSPTGKEAEAIQKVMAGGVAAVNNVTGIIEGQTSEVVGDNYDNVTVRTKKTVPVDGAQYEVTIDWTYDNTNNLVSSFNPLEGYEEYNKVFYFNFPAKGQPDAAFSFTATPKCNGVTGTAVTLNVTLKAETLVFPEYTIAQITETDTKPTATTSSESTYTGVSFKHVTYPEKGYWESNNSDNPDDTKNLYMFVTVKGKVVYLAPDGNWGLIADGNNYMEIYAGSGTQLMNKYFPGLKVGNYVAIRGEMGHYKGNVQLGYISRVTQIEKGSIQDPADYKTLTESYSFTNNQFSGDMNALVKVSGTYNGNLKDSNGVATTVDKLTDGRFTFDVQVGSKTVSIAYDYHVSKVEEGQPKVFDTYKTFLSKLQVGGAITVKGTLRFVFSGANVFTNEGSFSVTPYLATDLA